MWCAIYLGCLIVVGYAVAAHFARAATRLEITALALCIGPGVMGLCLILLSMCGLRPACSEILALTALAAAAGAVVWRKRGPCERLDPAGAANPHPLWTIACIIAIGYGLFSVGYDALVYRVSEWDAFAIWQLKAKVLALQPLRPVPSYFSDVNFSYSHLRYPLLVPMVSAGMHAMTGRLDDFGKAISLLWYVGTLGAVYALVRRMNGRTAALTATALLSCVAPMCRYEGSGTAEAALAAFYTCSLLCLIRWRQTGACGYLILAALFSAMMAWTKQEGLALAAINSLVVAGLGQNRRKSFAAAAALAATVAIIYLPWIIYTWGLPRTDEDYAARLTLHQMISNAGRILPAIAGLAVEMIDFKHWGLFWEIALALALLRWRRFSDRAIAAIGFLLLLHLLAYIPPLVVGSWELSVLLYTTSDRLILHAAPAGAILIGVLWPSPQPSARAPGAEENHS